MFFNATSQQWSQNNNNIGYCNNFWTKYVIMKCLLSVNFSLCVTEKLKWVGQKNKKLVQSSSEADILKLIWFQLAKQIYNKFTFYLQGLHYKYPFECIGLCTYNKFYLRWWTLSSAHLSAPVSSGQRPSAAPGTLSPSHSAQSAVWHMTQKAISTKNMQHFLCSCLPNWKTCKGFSHFKSKTAALLYYIFFLFVSIIRVESWRIPPGLYSHVFQFLAERTVSVK